MVILNDIRIVCAPCISRLVARSDQKEDRFFLFLCQECLPFKGVSLWFRLQLQECQRYWFPLSRSWYFPLNTRFGQNTRTANIWISSTNCGTQNGALSLPPTTTTTPCPLLPMYLMKLVSYPDPMPKNVSKDQNGVLVIPQEYLRPSIFCGGALPKKFMGKTSWGCDN